MRTVLKKTDEYDFKWYSIGFIDTLTICLSN